jgi:Ca2+-binding RTX toxin-like protein
MANLFGTSGNNVLDAIGYGNSNDNLYGYEGHDTLYGWDGNDNIYAGSGNDIAYGENGNDYIDGWTGNDYLSGGNGHDTLLGYDGHDTLYGDAGNDFLYGEKGTDKLFGGLGNDVLNGGGYAYNSGEYDEMTGGAGADTFVLGNAFGNYYKGVGYAIIKDFNYGEGDKIKLNLNQYDLVKGVNMGVGGSALDSAIYHKGTTDLVAVIQDKSGIAVLPNLDFIAA